MNIYGVIMAGGGGTRFWPLSRQKNPKQLLNLSGNDAMINEAALRLSFLTEKEKIFVVTNKNQVSSMQKITNGRILDKNILSEPAARNTAACVGYAAMEIIKKYGDGIMVITPSDHYIKDTAGFTRVMNRAISTAETEDKLVTIGITPTFPSTGFGYIKYNKVNAGKVNKVLEFKEKPCLEKAKEYVESGNYAWNSGMFVWKASLILEKFKNLTPDIYKNLEKIGEAIGSKQESDILEEVYPNIRKISIDFAIMEPSAEKGDVMVVPGDFGWNDVGSWDMMDVLHEEDKDGNILIGDTISINTTNSVVYSSSKVVTTVGVDDLVVVETPDAIMVCNKTNAQDVKLIVDALIKQNREELL